ncbi:hypothetical protein [Paraburkholderia piptadeniae]|uniref:hypothetical protein n=1 Tax=Paraburkholderia piptadeniae TaxID=1701573 RepID=UPI003F697665
MLNQFDQLHRTSETIVNEIREFNMPDYDAVHDLRAHRPDPTTPDTPDEPEPGQPPEPDQPDQPDTVPDPTREPVEPDAPPIGDPPSQPSQTPHTRPGAALRGGAS